MSAMSVHVVRSGAYLRMGGKPTQVPSLTWLERYRYRTAYRYGVYCDACRWAKVLPAGCSERDAARDGHAHAKHTHPQLMIAGAMYFNPELALSADQDGMP